MEKSIHSSAEVFKFYVAAITVTIQIISVKVLFPTARTERLNFYRQRSIGIAITMPIFSIKLRPDIILSFSSIDKQGHH